jgi:hypothetical protein
MRREAAERAAAEAAKKAAAEKAAAEAAEPAGVTAWLALTNTQKEQSLVAATMAINPLQWKGQPASSDQALAWPMPSPSAEEPAAEQPEPPKKKAVAAVAKPRPNTPPRAA